MPGYLQPVQAHAGCFVLWWWRLHYVKRLLYCLAATVNLGFLPVAVVHHVGLI